MHTKRMKAVMTVTLALLLGWVVGSGCATSQGDLVDKKLELLEAQFSKLEQHKVSRGVGETAARPAQDGGGLPVVKLHKLRRSPTGGGWDSGTGTNLDEPEVRVAARPRAPQKRYAKVQRARRKAVGMDDAGNLLDADGKVIYRAGSGSPARTSGPRAPQTRRVWEKRPATPGVAAKPGIKPMPRLKQFQIGRSGGAPPSPGEPGDNIRFESAPPAPPIPPVEGDDLGEPEINVAPPVARRKRAARRKAGAKPKRVAKPRIRYTAVSKAHAPRPARTHKRRNKPVPRIARAPRLKVKAPVRRQHTAVRTTKPRPMPKLRRTVKRPSSKRPVRRKAVKRLVIKRAPGPQRLTKQVRFKGNRERHVKRLYNKALSAFRNGDDTAASAGFRTLLRVYYVHELADNALYWLGETVYRSGGWLQALSYFQDVIIRYPDGNKVGDAMVKSALCYARLGETSYAAKVLADVENLFPASPLARVARERRLALGLGDS